MKEIVLTQGQVALIDDEDYEWLSRWKWCADRKNGKCSYYAVSTHMGKRIRMHNLVYKKYNSEEYSELDHIDKNGLNNTKSNLRTCSRSENNFNRRNYGILPKGVRMDRHKYTKRNGDIVVYERYQARINVNGKSIFLGNYSNLDDAINVYTEASKKYYPNYAMYL